MSYPVNNYPKLHNAAWPGVVGKGSDTPEPIIGLDTMLAYTTAAEVNGVKFDGIDLFLSAPHVDIDSSDDGLKVLAEKLQTRGLVTGSLVAPVWSGNAFGTLEQRRHWLEQVRKACQISRVLCELGVRPSGVIRIDSSGSVAEWSQNPAENTRRIIGTFKEAGKIAADSGQRLAAEGEICWGGMHSWRAMLDVLEGVGQPEVVGFQADLAHTLLYLMGYNAPDARLLPENFDWSDTATFRSVYSDLVAQLRPWTIDFHVAQNDATVKGQGSHDKTGRHCLPNDPNGKLDVVWCAGQWLRDEKGELTRLIPHICWDGCMFTNEIMESPATWNSILKSMLDVRAAHGWQE